MLCAGAGRAGLELLLAVAECCLPLGYGSVLPASISNLSCSSSLEVRQPSPEQLQQAGEGLKRSSKRTRSKQKARGRRAPCSHRLRTWVIPGAGDSSHGSGGDRMVGKAADLELKKTTTSYKEGKKTLTLVCDCGFFSFFLLPQGCVCLCAAKSLAVTLYSVSWLCTV